MNSLVAIDLVKQRNARVARAAARTAARRPALASASADTAHCRRATVLGLPLGPCRPEPLH